MHFRLSSSNSPRRRNSKSKFQASESWLIIEGLKLFQTFGYLLALILPAMRDYTEEQVLRMGMRCRRRQSPPGSDQIPIFCKTESVERALRLRMRALQRPYTTKFLKSFQLPTSKRMQKLIGVPRRFLSETRSLLLPNGIRIETSENSKSKC